MEKEFVPYKLAVKLKELEFDEPCIAYYVGGEDRFVYDIYTVNNFSGRNILIGEAVATPLWQQVFEWFRNKYKFKVGIGINDKGLYYDYKIVLFNTTDTYYKDCYNTYKEAREACLLKLIELCQKSEKI